MSTAQPMQTESDLGCERSKRLHAQMEKHLKWIHTGDTATAMDVV